MKGRVIYRLPFETQCRWIEGNLRMLDTSTIMASLQGYIIAPFLATSKEPVMHIDADQTEVFPQEAIPQIEGFDAPEQSEFPEEETSRELYGEAFRNFHDAILRGECRKIVLARSQNETTAKALHPLDIFRKACVMYPRMMITMFSTPVSGTWIVCSPEILLEREGQNWHTVAMAGTMPWQENLPEWDEKNKNEQQLVELYIKDVLRHFTANIHLDGPKNARAAHLVHLKTDITFTVSENQKEGVLVRVLHPTPAVCGLPRDVAYNIINNSNIQKGENRHYFSGFSGPVCIDDATRVFVSLRCMRVHSLHQFTLYAGGGLMSQSDEETEWQETAEKMKTTLNLLKACEEDKP